jgi:hypothetical protein
MTDEDLAEMMYNDWCEALGAPQFESTWEDLTTAQQKRWIYVAEMVREPVINSLKDDLLEDIRAMEDINTTLRDRLWVIMQQCADQLGVDIEVDRY